MPIYIFFVAAQKMKRKRTTVHEAILPSLTLKMK